MATLAEFKTKLSRLTATKGLDDDTLEDYIDAALEALGEYQPERVLMKKVPVNIESEGYYDVPADASTVSKVFVHGTDIEISFEVERNSQTNERKIRVGPIERPQTLFVAGHVDAVDYSVNENTFANSARRGIQEGYDYFDIAYLRSPTFENLDRTARALLQLYVEHLGYEAKAGEVSNLVDITDTDPSGDATTIRQSAAGRQYLNLAKDKKAAFDMRAIKPYGTRDTTQRAEYFYGIDGVGVV